MSPCRWYLRRHAYERRTYATQANSILTCLSCSCSAFAARNFCRSFARGSLWLLGTFCFLQVHVQRAHVSMPSMGPERNTLRVPSTHQPRSSYLSLPLPGACPARSFAFRCAALAPGWSPECASLSTLPSVWSVTPV